LVSNRLLDLPSIPEALWAYFMVDVDGADVPRTTIDR